MSGTTVLVRPASARHETFWIAIICALIVAAASGFIALHGREDTGRSLEEWQIDARTDLGPAEQGVLADLTIAAGEIAWLADADGLPSVEALAREGIPPFAPSPSDSLRGDHGWQLSGGAYLGRSNAPDVAGSFLLVAGDTPAIWLFAGNAADAPVDLSPEALASIGWRQVVSHYDASVTRHGLQDEAAE